MFVFDPNKFCFVFLVRFVWFVFKISFLKKNSGWFVFCLQVKRKQNQINHDANSVWKSLQPKAKKDWKQPRIARASILLNLKEKKVSFKQKQKISSLIIIRSILWQFSLSLSLPSHTHCAEFNLLQVKNENNHHISCVCVCVIR